jgi:hypothetical protein
MPKVKVKSSAFSYKRISLPGSNILYVVSIKVITPDLKKYIDRKLGQITYGDEGADLKRVKERIKKFLKKKQGTDLEIGAIAEFFVHLFLSHRGLKPKFIISNLEEGSLKKGFDGLYIYKDEEWLCESKSGSLKSTGVNHHTKVREAYRGLKNKLAGQDLNNPWSNALHHAKVAGAENSLLKSIVALSNQFEDGQYHKIDDFNIIPCATIYLDGKADNMTTQIIENKIKTILSSFSYKNIRVVCITKESVKAFWTYLNS